MGKAVTLHCRLTFSRAARSTARSFQSLKSTCWAYLSVSVLDGGYVGLAEGPFHETQYKRAFTNAARSEHHHPVVVALLRHPDICRPDAVNPRQSGSLLKDPLTVGRSVAHNEKTRSLTPTPRYLAKRSRRPSALCKRVIFAPLPATVYTGQHPPRRLSPRRSSSDASEFS